jgi:thiol-disulfide isomerase/thioredoxin
MRPADEHPAAPLPAVTSGAAAGSAARLPAGGGATTWTAWQARLAVGALALCGLAALFWPRGEGTRTSGGFVVDASGRAATIGSHLAPVSLVHFWATWCPPCLTEIPALQRLARDLAGSPDFRVIMVAVADDRGKVGALMGEASEAVLFDPNWEVARRYGTTQLPETYLVVQGEVVEKWVGATDWNDPGVRHRILEHLPEAELRAAVGPP